MSTCVTTLQFGQVSGVCGATCPNGDIEFTGICPSNQLCCVAKEPCSSFPDSTCIAPTSSYSCANVSGTSFNFVAYCAQSSSEQCCSPPPSCSQAYGGTCSAQYCAGTYYNPTDCPSSEICCVTGGSRGSSVYCFQLIFGLFLGIVLGSLLLSCCKVDRLLGVKVLQKEVEYLMAGRMELVESESDFKDPSAPAQEARSGADVKKERELKVQEEITAKLLAGNIFWGIRHAAIPTYLQAHWLFGYVLPCLRFSRGFIESMKDNFGDFLFHFQNTNSLFSMFLCPKANHFNRNRRRLLFYANEGTAYFFFVFITIISIGSSPAAVNVLTYVTVVPFKVLMKKFLYTLIVMPCFATCATSKASQRGKTLGLIAACVKAATLQVGLLSAGVACVAIGTTFFLTSVLLTQLLNLSCADLVLTYAIKVYVNGFILEVLLSTLKFLPFDVPSDATYAGKLIKMLGVGTHTYQKREAMAAQEASIAMQELGKVPTRDVSALILHRAANGATVNPLQQNAPGEGGLEWAVDQSGRTVSTSTDAGVIRPPGEGGLEWAVDQNGRTVSTSTDAGVIRPSGEGGLEWAVDQSGSRATPASVDDSDVETPHEPRVSEGHN